MHLARFLNTHFRNVRFCRCRTHARSHNGDRELCRCCIHTRIASILYGLCFALWLTKSVLHIQQEPFRWHFRYSRKEIALRSVCVCACVWVYSFVFHSNSNSVLVFHCWESYHSHSVCICPCSESKHYWCMHQPCVTLLIHNNNNNNKINGDDKRIPFSTSCRQFLFLLFIEHFVQFVNHSVYEQLMCELRRR